MDKLRPKNWAQFQHYRTRRPPWIKLHRVLLDDYEYHQLPDASKALAPLLWLLASESEGGAFEYASNMLAFRLHTTPEKIQESITPLIDKGFFLVVANASAMLAPCKQDAIPETERETYKQETETDEKKRVALGKKVFKWTSQKGVKP